MEIKKETFTKEQKREIAYQIKPICFETVKTEFDELKNLAQNPACLENISERCRLGNNVVDYFSFAERLETKGKYNVNYFGFIRNIELFEEKKFIQTMIHYYNTEKNKKGTKNKYIVWKEIYFG